MPSRNRKITAGLFAIGAAALVAFAALAFGGMRVLRGGAIYRVEYAGTVYGLVDGANVYMSGVRVGTVEGIEVSPDDPRRVRVRIVVRGGTPVRTDTVAMLQLAGITGLKIIDLRGGSPGAPPLLSGSTIPPGETVLDKLEQRAEDLADQTAALMARSNQILDNVAKVTDPQGELFQAATRSATELAAAGATLRAIIGENRASLRRSIDAIGHTARGADDVIAQLKSMIGANGPALRAAMLDLRQASRSLKDLAREVRQRPSRLLFSGAQRERRMP
jgi:phospholipid/cholesterol/gamma-HCH transport system substrate-binding protein